MSETSDTHLAAPRALAQVHSLPVRAESVHKRLLDAWPVVVGVLTIVLAAGGIVATIREQGARIDRIEAKVDRLLERK
jgi:hypothetical protein